MDFTKNLLLSIMKTGTHPNVTVVAEDDASFKALTAVPYTGLQILTPDMVGMPSGVLTRGSQAALEFRTPDYLKLVNRRPTYILDFVQRGYEVFFIDADMVWFADPFPYFTGDFDFALPEDHPKDYNCGVVYFRPTDRTLEFLKLWIWVIENRKGPKQDQLVMNEIIRSGLVRDLKIKVLSGANFLDGRSIVGRRKVCRKITKQMAVFHASFLIGPTRKRHMFSKCKLWLNANQTST